MLEARGASSIGNSLRRVDDDTSVATAGAATQHGAGLSCYKRPRRTPLRNQLIRINIILST